MRDIPDLKTGRGAVVGGVLGPENMPDAGGNAGGGDSNYTKESTTANNAVGETTEVVQAAPGGLIRLTVSVVMDQALAGNLPQAQIQALVEDAVGLLAGPDFEVLLDKLAATSFVLVDTPPAGLFADAGAVARSCDGYLLVVRAGAGRRADLEETIGRLDQVGALPLGAVLNRSRLPASRYTYGRGRRSYNPVRFVKRRH